MMQSDEAENLLFLLFFLLSSFFSLSLSLYAKNQSDQNIVETINQILLPALKKRDSQVFHVDFFPVVSPIKGEIFSPPSLR